MKRIKGGGPNQRAILAALACGDAMSLTQLALHIPSANIDAARDAVNGLRKRSLAIEVERIGQGRGAYNSYRLLQYPDRPWLPVSMIPDFHTMMASGEYNETEARRIIEDHLTVVERRKVRAA